MARADLTDAEWAVAGGTANLERIETVASGSRGYDAGKKVNGRRLPAHHETMVHWSMIIIMSRRLGEPVKSHQPQAA